MFVNLIVFVLIANFGCIISESNDELVSDVYEQPVPCTYNSDCAGRWNTCSLKIGDQLYCQCKEGSSGDNCTLVDQCRDGQVDCGTAGDVSCLLGDGGKAHCHCDDEYRGFDQRTKTCRDCECGKNSLVIGCDFEGDKKTCYCSPGAYRNDEGNCVECGCGDHSIGCTFENGVKACWCYAGYASNGSTCIDCECGLNARCTMENGKTVCSCIPGYIPAGPIKECIMQCNASNPCEHGGTCSGGVCSCLNGTFGDLCQHIEDCLCGEADCLYDVVTEKAYCKCRNPDLEFDVYSKECRVCDCGPHSKDCKFNFGFKKCTCEELYYDLKGTCTSCTCKGPTRSCRFDRQENQQCECDKGYTQWKDDCKECDCGDDGVCEFDEYSGFKRCHCNRGYESNGEKCLPCDCGENGTCGLYAFNEARCTCHEGFKEYQGKCLACDCGANAECSFSETGEKQCVCIPGYAMKSEVCTACNCGDGGNCSFAENTQETAIKHCFCPEGLEDDNGICRECDCRLESSNCTFIEGVRACQCPQGFSEARNSSNQLAFCQDVDECLDSAACPKTARCVNTIGSYECVCGDEKTATLRNVKEEGCPTGGLSSLEIAGIVGGCIIGAFVIIGGIDEYRKYRLKRTELQSSHPYQSMT